ncbi:uncharacterized protein Dana_GF25081, isoform B [Drosophila ananassae]|uniref:Hexosyltransferase n=1 Tax=Drosophila ananassae TaxID=7217 RepID=B3M944_DROAN|nr:beta-1,3-galactosyltransferase 5 [Drosophila ananassae]XP_014765415.1 beta-1,3-galactosyltransferase 5 [Drosophila ananassae]XP_044571090.1 beta-1,3-galactosyltransferase 5 [Drosophila ananassae]EDV38988.1 uncharacterized protein Dana_GF25081, isoform A [Drosophila ananassae]KPU77795.1 uncharacterized protein Dana_GF25081, isoform B [Drosophila ananassae]
MDKRSLCLLVICIKMCLVIWLVSWQQPAMLESEMIAEAAALGGGGSRGGTSPPPPPPPPPARRGLRSGSGTGIAIGSNPNQITQPSRTHFSFNDSIVSNTFERPVTPPPLASQTPTPPQSSMQLMDLSNFVYTIDQEPCEPRVQVLVLVHSAIPNFEKRRVIRHTWAERSYIERTPLRVIFLLGGVGDGAENWQHLVERENSLHGDLVQGNFDDAYRNMTYKHVMALKWFTENCPQAQLMVKVDDDVYINTPQLVKYFTDPELPEHALLHQPDLLLCRPVKKSRVKRTYRSKWRVTYKEYPHRFYPPYCPGLAIVYSPEVVRRLFGAAQKANYFWVDDVLITGILTEATGTKITKLTHYLEQYGVRQLLKGETELEKPAFLFTTDGIRPDESLAIWQMTVDSNFTLTTPSSASTSASASASASLASALGNSANTSRSQTSRGIS